jgi:hypothetical protein
MRARPVLVFLPAPWEIDGGLPLGARLFGDYCRATGADCVDAAPLLRSEATRLGTDAARRRYYRQLHMSPDGNRLVADAISKHLGLEKKIAQ